MLNRTMASNIDVPVEPTDRRQETIGLADIVIFFRRYFVTVFACTIAAIVVAAYIVGTTTAIYTATAEVLIDPRVSEIQREQLGEVAVPLDTAQIESQLALLRSEGIARSVALSLNLNKDPEFSVRGISLLARLAFWQRLAPAPSPDELDRIVILTFQSRLDVQRVGISYGIRISFSSQFPDKAARIANAIASIYVRDQVETRAKAAQAGSLWLEEKITVIRQKMNAAARSTQEFKASHDYRLAPRIDKLGDSDAQQGPKSGRRDLSITLEELEATAQTYRKLYESYLLAYTEALQRESYPVSNARVISTALPPNDRSHPRTQLILIFSALAGALSGVGIALLRSSMDNSVVSPQQLQTLLGTECLGKLPRLSSASQMSLRALVVARLVRLKDQLLARSGEPEPQSPVSDVVSIAPYSGYAQSIRRLRESILVNSGGSQLASIGIVATSCENNRYAVAINLASAHAASGSRVLLIDADLETNRLSCDHAPEAERGLLDVAYDRAELQTCLLPASTDRIFALLPARGSATGYDGNASIDAATLQLAIDEFATAYEMIVVNLPTPRASSGPALLGAVTDGVVVVVDWGRTPGPLVAELTAALRRARAVVLGAVLAEVPSSVLAVDGGG